MKRGPHQNINELVSIKRPESDQAHDQTTLALSNLDHILIENLLKEIISNANLSLYLSAQRVKGKREYINALLSSDPLRIVGWVQEGMKKNSQLCTLLLAILAPAYFINNLSRHPFMASDFIWQVKESTFRGTNPLWFLAHYVETGTPAPFLAVLMQYPGAFNASTFTTQAEDGPFKRTTALWLLANAAANGKPEAMIAVLTQYPRAFTAADFTRPAENGPCKGQSALWLTAAVALNGMPDLFMTILRQYPNAFTALDFIKPAEDGPNKGKSILWLLACAVANGKPEALKMVLTQYQSTFTGADFMKAAEDGPYKGTTALGFVAVGAARGQPDALLAVLSHVILNALALESIPKKDLPKEINNLIAWRYQFRFLCENGSSNDQQLFLAAYQAGLAGYHEAYYELGEYFEKHHNIYQAINAFLHISPKSLLVEKLNCAYSARCIGMALEGRSEVERLLQIENATKFALKIIDVLKRNHTLQTIARIYINNLLGNGCDVKGEIIPEHLLEVMHSETDAGWCFKVFEQLAETERLKQLLQDKQERIDQLNEKLKKEKDNPSSSEMFAETLKEVLTSFRIQKKRQETRKTSNEEINFESKVDFNMPKLSDP